MLEALANWSRETDDSQTLDPVTSVLNRNSFIRMLQELVIDNRPEAACVFGICNIEQFKLINHSHGYEAGDYVLHSKAQSMCLEFDEDTIIGRIGNDEFGFLSFNKSVAHMQTICESFSDAMQETPLSWMSKDISLSLKFGIIEIDQHEQSINYLLRSVSDAIYSASYDGCATVCAYDSGNTAILRRNSNMEQAAIVKNWISQNLFTLYIQPTVNLHSKPTISHFEILIRGIPENNRIISPGNLIKAAEDFNLTPDLDKWVINKLFKWINQNKSNNSDKYRFSFNLSALSINDHGLADYIIDTAEQEKIDPKRINIEITERVAISNMKKCYSFMMKLRKVGFTFSLDDFGSGYCSFKYIKSLPFDIIKIDGSFIKDINENKENYTIVKAIVDVAHGLGRRTVAEYVETKEVEATVKELGIEYAQGHYYAKAYPIDDINKPAPQSS
jgi:diguanylate cyclase (GGDEF)-like protein